MDGREMNAAFVPRRGDRRRARWQTVVVALSGRGRRRALRREADRRHGSLYLDRYSLTDGLWLLTAVLLCVSDAAFTLLILSAGGQELNPLMAWLLSHDVTAFFWVKFLLTSGALLFVLLHRNFRFLGRLRGVHVLYATTLGYGALVTYELVLLDRLFGL